MRFCRLLILLLVPNVISAQQPAKDSPQALGRVTGHIYCSDTQRPAHFASIQLLSDQESAKSQDDILAGLMKDNGKDGGVLGNALTKSLSLVMKGSNLSTIAAMDGSFSLNKVPAGTYYVIPQLAGYVSPIGQLSQKERMQAGDAAMKALANGAEKVEVQADSTAIVNIELVRGASISGTIRYDDGSPAPGVTPVLLSLGANGKWSELPPPSMLPTVTSDDGQFRFSGLPTGRYAVKAALPTSAATMGIGLSSLSMHVNTGDALVAYSGDVLWERDLKPIELKAGTERAGVDIVFPVNGLHSVSGTVVAMADGHSINTGSVELEDPSTKASVRMTMIGRDGSFQFDYVPEGTYRVEVTGALDVESASGDDSDNPMMAMLLSGSKPKSVKAYGNTAISITLPGNAEGLRMQVPDATERKP